MKIFCVTQARFGSNRFPGKVLKKIQDDETILGFHLNRLKKSERVDTFIVATTLEKESEAIVAIAEAKGVIAFKGDEKDVLGRFYHSLLYHGAKDEDVIVRVTSDCPLIDPQLIDFFIDRLIKKNMDYVSTSLSDLYPDGVDCEVFRFNTLEYAFKNAKLDYEREHVTPYIWQHSTSKGGHLFKSEIFHPVANFSKVRLTVDYPEDLTYLKTLLSLNVENLGFEELCSKILDENIMNRNLIKRNEGFWKSQAESKGLRFIDNFKESDRYRDEIHDLIPGGCHTYSKGDDQFPALSPAAIAYGKGVHVWDLDGNQFLDCSMGLTSVSLGHAYAPVLERVKDELDKGVNFQRPSYIEREVAKKFLNLLPGHDRIKFAKNGSTVTTAAVKLARAHTSRSLVAFPYDHPFYSYDDWFISSTPCDFGIPKEVKNYSITYKSEDLNSLKEIFEKYPGQISCVISEPEKPHGLPAGYLQEAISFVQSQGALYIMDEMITGFKTAYPGSMTKHGVLPDMATWGKGIANGFSFCALTGKKEVMDLGGIKKPGAEKLFLISSTHGGETSAIAAALATMNEFEKKDVVGHNHRIGNLLVTKLKDCIRSRKMEDFLIIQDAPWMQIFIFRDNRKEACAGLRTLMLQEMIKRGVLFQGVFIPCFSHTDEDVAYFVKAFEDSLNVYTMALETGFENYLMGPVCKPVFRKII